MGSVHVLGLIVRQGAVLAVAGIGVGIPAAPGAARLPGSQLYAIRPADGFTFTAAPLALVASLAPAIRATGIDCVEVLKAERERLPPFPGAATRVGGPCGGCRAPARPGIKPRGPG